ncbi:DUF305 domain-containing protein [Aliterella atlantica]|uniref:DUF305 domain-containing protein n=1 Tax=Aliterella atlantica CENA595 TaxID=1618023 RepID=A0A0D8ZMV7_9CYAN|nr:DUF305 domain-containing protein [Aliterella atlantica]KJH70095.1 hypothetical protein UH38_20215 [Aliterella atlantica CENA595]
MNRKFAIYSIVALLAGSTITIFSLTDSAKAEDHAQVQSPRPANTMPMERGMEMRVEVDKPFIEMMIPHHQSANKMAQMALNRATSPEVKKLAQSIIEEQTREIEQMQTWYKQWYGTEVPSNGMNMGMQNGMAQSMMQMEMMDREMMETLENAQNFDREFLRQMTRHHQMATMMAGMVVNSAQHREIRNLAQNIIKSQSAEITQMQQLLQAMTTSSQNTSI